MYRGAVSLDAQESRILWAVCLSQLTANLYEEVRGVAAPVLFAQHLGGASGSAALGLAHLFLLELVVTCLIAFFCSGRRTAGKPDLRGEGFLELLGLGKIMLLAVLLNAVGLAVMVCACAISVRSSGKEGCVVQLFACGHIAYSLGSMVRDTVFPTLATCFREELVVHLNARKHVLMHLGALVGGGFVAAGLFRCYVMFQAAGFLLGLGFLLSAQNDLDAMSPMPSRGQAGSASLYSGCGLQAALLQPMGEQSKKQADDSKPRASFGLMILARFVQSFSFAFSSPVIVLNLLQSSGLVHPTHGAGAGGASSTTWTSAAQLLASANVLGHVSSLAVNLWLDRQRRLAWHRSFLLASLTYAISVSLMPILRRPEQYLVLAAALRGARALGKAASDAMTFRVGKHLGKDRAPAFFARRTAFKVGLLSGKYGLATFLSGQPGENLPFGLIFAIAAATSVAATVLQLLGLSAFARPDSRFRHSW
eukprot:TRINITY_DN23040_c0_g1_i1.p1 TRINITY_DN23040_c0_g1~~TRINITY_DN23040_c0_g1_i1.p1  ORF type:complete len:479 (-),score=86.71 TRINITY_DN23040_c0_g1_i1:108-1544(-)